MSSSNAVLSLVTIYTLYIGLLCIVANIYMYKISADIICAYNAQSTSLDFSARARRTHIFFLCMMRIYIIRQEYTFLLNMYDDIHAITAYYVHNNIHYTPGARPRLGLLKCARCILSLDYHYYFQSLLLLLLNYYYCQCYCSIFLLNYCYYYYTCILLLSYC